jgi:hypothetical protein
MNLSPLERIELYRQARIVLVRHLIDLGHVTIQVAANHLHLRGSMVRLPGVTAKLTADVMQAIMAELGRIPGVRRASAELDNWTTDGGGGWKPVEGAKSGGSDVFIDPTPRTFDLGKPKDPDSPK